MKILVTGGCGYIGYDLVQQLILRPEVEEVFIYDNFSRKEVGLFLGKLFENHHKIKFFQGDILDNYSLKKAVKDKQVVIHLAAKVTTPFADHNAHEFDQVNHWGTACVVDAVEQSEVEHFIYLSSIAVYGSSSGDTIDENTNTNPRSFYGKSKLRAEQQVRRLPAKIKSTIIRAGNVYGFNPCMRLDAVVNKLIFEAHFKKKVQINGDGNQKRAFLHTTHLVNTILDITFNKGESHPLFNLVSHSSSINEIVGLLEKIYPSLEKTNVNQHMIMRSISAKSLYRKNEKRGQDLFLNELKEIKSHFSF